MQSSHCNLPIQTLHSVAPEIQVFVSSLKISAKRAHPWIQKVSRQGSRNMKFVWSSFFLIWITCPMHLSTEFLSCFRKSLMFKSKMWSLTLWGRMLSFYQCSRFPLPEIPLISRFLFHILNGILCDCHNRDSNKEHNTHSYSTMVSIHVIFKGRRRPLMWQVNFQLTCYII